MFFDYLYKQASEKRKVVFNLYDFECKFMNIHNVHLLFTYKNKDVVSSTVHETNLAQNELTLPSSTIKKFSLGNKPISSKNKCYL